MNKKTKEAKRRDPSNSVNIGAGTALLQHDRDIEKRLKPVFPHLHDPSEGVMNPPDAKTVLSLARMVHWTELNEPVKAGKDAANQKPLCGVEQNLDIIQKVIRRLGRAAQFGLDDTDDAGSGSDGEDDSDEQ